MKLAISIGSAQRHDVRKNLAFVQHAERLGVQSAWSAEGWGSDGLTSLAYLAPLTSTMQLGTGILQISARVPAMTAMSACSMHTLTEGRFILGLGVSGPQVVEGLHGTDYSGPLSRLKEHLEICRMAFRGEKLNYKGRYHELPRPGGEGKALRLDHEPCEIPIYLATLSPRALRYTGEAADGWLGTSFSPEHADAHLQHIKDGAEAAGRSLEAINLQVACPVAISDDFETIIEARKRNVAFSMGAMGSEKTNFYNQAYQRAGYTDDALAIQQLWLAGNRDAAVKRVPSAMVSKFGAYGTEAMVRERFKQYQAAGINTLQLRFDSLPEEQHFEVLEQAVDLLPNL